MIYCPDGQPFEPFTQVAARAEQAVQRAEQAEAEVQQLRQRLQQLGIAEGAAG